jgi:CSLREA domain-containing protein
MAVALVALACALVLAPVAVASEFMVNSTADEVDSAPGDESCLTAGGKCTLRAAIEAGESLEEFFRIDFDEEIFEGQAAATIALGSSLPAITFPAFVNGRTCETEAEVSGPCVGIDGPGGEPALIVRNAEEVEISGLAITGAQTGIGLEGSPRTKIQGSWFGVALDGLIAGNGTGVLVRPGSNRSLIGGEGAGQGDVFAGNAGDGLDIHGGNNVRVFGNYFGVEPDGDTPSANGGDDIEVVSTEGLEVTGTAIGTRVSSTAAASPGCDGGCNVISGASSNGVDLEGEGEENPAASTSVVGNYIGLNAEGSAAVANAGAGVDVGKAAHTVVGGPSGGEANRINGGSVGVLAGPAAGDLAVRGNLIGTDATGTGTLAPPDDGIVVDSAELPSPTLEAEIVGNEVRMEDGIAILQRGQGAWIFGNQIFGSETGIGTSESTAEYGNVIEGNLIEGPAVSGILIENNLNEVVGNEILGSGAAGIWVEGSSLPFGVSGNRIGGDAAADENFIAASGGDAIKISNLEATENEVARNRGSGNGGLFIDLVPASPGTEPKGPNNGVEPPAFLALAEAGADGSAEPGATVRVFRKQLAAAGEIESFLGKAVVESSGSWKVAYGSAVPPGTIVAATQTTEAGGTSELAIATTAGSGNPGGGGGNGDAVSGAGTGSAAGSFVETIQIRPRTKIVKAPRKSHHGTARFVFESDEAGSVFLCKLDGKPFDICESPKKYKHLKPGRHVFQVRAVDPSGHVDLSPAKKEFTVLG